MKITRYMGAFAVIAMLAACSTDEEQGTNTAANEVKITATVGGNSIFTRSNPVGSATEQENFNENDVISVTTEAKPLFIRRRARYGHLRIQVTICSGRVMPRLSRLVIQGIPPILSLRVISKLINLTSRKLLSLII